MADVTKFINKETGEIHIGEVVIGPDTKWDDIERLAPYAEVDADDEVCCLTMKERLVAANIPVSVEVTLFSEKYRRDKLPRITLMCEPPEEYDAPKEWNYIWLDAGKVWLKAVLGEPDGESESYIEYKFAWGDVYICVAEDQRNDLRGGEIEVNYIRERV